MLLLGTQVSVDLNDNLVIQLLCQSNEHTVLCVNNGFYCFWYAAAAALIAILTSHMCADCITHVMSHSFI